jgi:hypothetical protein
MASGASGGGRKMMGDGQKDWANNNKPKIGQTI